MPASITASKKAMPRTLMDLHPGFSFGRPGQAWPRAPAAKSQQCCPDCRIRADTAPHLRLRLTFLFEHDLFRKPLHTFRDHALNNRMRNEARAVAGDARPVLADA